MKPLRILLLATFVWSVGACAQQASLDDSADLIAAREAFTAREQSLAENLEGVRACMEDEGLVISIERTDLGALRVTGSNAKDQAAVWEAVFEQCNAAIFGGAAGSHVAERSDVYLRRLHAYSLILRECLAVEGYSTSEPPSLEAFIESSGAWSPYDNVAPGVNVPQGQWLDLLAQCPQQPGFEPGDS